MSEGLKLPSNGYYQFSRLMEAGSASYRDPRSVIRYLIYITAFVLMATFAGAVPAGGDNSPSVRLLLSDALPRVVVGGDSLLVEKKDGEKWEPVIEKLRLASFSPAPEGVRLEGSEVRASGFRIRPGRGLISYSDRFHRGYLTVLPSSGGLITVSNVPLESYLVGVVNGEIDSSWPIDAVKAQVVAARSYALYQVRSGKKDYDLKTDVTHQVYAGVDSEDMKAAEAVTATEGLVLYRGRELVQAFFHSSCGGSTASAVDTWGLPQHAQEGVYCGQCDDAPYARWNLSPEIGELARSVMALSPGTKKVLALGIHRKSPDGRVQTLYAETERGRVLIDAGEFRRQIGYMRLPSTRFSLGITGNRIIITGSGYGHGVGLCQWGARGSALRGMDYRQILRKYYPGTELRRAY